MSAAEVLQLPLLEKLQIMEALWEDLRKRADKLDIPQDQKALLDARRARVGSGEATILDWDSVKQFDWSGMIKVKISSDAFADLDDGFSFYESQESGLGDYFSSCLRADIDRLKISGGIHRSVYRDYRRLLSIVFPYGIFYTFDNETATVWAVIDCRRDPDWIRSHLDK